MGEGEAGGGGGGIWTEFGSLLTLINTTVAGNTAGRGGRGGPGSPGGPGGGGGGGILVGGGDGVAPVTLSSTNATISADATGAGGAGGVDFLPGGHEGSPGAAGAGGGIDAETHGIASEANTLVASNAPQNCAGAITNGAHDLSFPDATCPGVDGDPELGPLASNGGPMQTMALAPGSAAINQIPAAGANCPATDQRGVPRPQPPGGLCDIGAYEFVFAPICQPVSVSTAVDQSIAVQLACVDGAGAPLTHMIVAGPSHGTLAAVAPANARVVYTPQSGYSGPDAFTYHATSANGTAITQAVSITVTPPGQGTTSSGQGTSSSSQGTTSSGQPTPPPAIEGLRVSPARVTAAARGGSIASLPEPSKTARGKRKQKQAGATVSYTDTEAATTTFTVLQVVRGVRSGHACVAPARHSSRHRKTIACTRLVVVGRFSHRDSAGANSFRFTARVNGHSLKPGTYRLQVVPTLAGKNGAQASDTFTVIA
jgi:Bacterial Ig domain